MSIYKKLMMLGGVAALAIGSAGVASADVCRQNAEFFWGGGSGQSALICSHGSASFHANKTDGKPISGATVYVRATDQGSGGVYIDITGGEGVAILNGFLCKQASGSKQCFYKFNTGGNAGCSGDCVVTYTNESSGPVMLQQQ